jgi:hypothetical protein
MGFTVFVREPADVRGHVARSAERTLERNHDVASRGGGGAGLRDRAAHVARAEDGVPRAVVEAPVHDFGQVERGVPIDHVFKVKNTGTGWMRIDHVKGTCACTVGTATGEPIPPGGEAWVTMRLETDKLAGPHDEDRDRLHERPGRADAARDAHRHGAERPRT